MTTALLAIVAYLLGAIPFGLLIGRAHGIDIRTRGSRNIGATNVGRVIGRKWGYLCLVLDILKGFGPTLCAALILGPRSVGPERHLSVLLVALAAVLGHVFPIYLGFRGGKGVATTVGVALGVWPHYTIAMGISLLAYGLARLATGLVSVGSLALAIVFPLAVLVYAKITGLRFAAQWPLLAAALLLGLMIIIRHRDNIRRLLGGQETTMEAVGTELPSGPDRGQNDGSDSPARHQSGSTTG